MKISDYDYNLPDKLIASIPPTIRGTSRLLVLNRKNGEIADKKYSDVCEYLNSGDVLVLNNTKVIKARLKTTKDSGVVRELVILERHSYDNDWFKHRVIYRGKIKTGDTLHVGDSKILVESIEGDGIAIIKSDRNLLDLVDQYGEVPLPPYMARDATSADEERYQTVWAKISGSVAAPTASLNMTDEIIDSLKQKGVVIVYATLHVGLGTFLPIRSDTVEGHRMHQEYFEIPKETTTAIKLAKNNGNRVIALGTTIARSLEYASDRILTEDDDLVGEADIFIFPGYEFKMIDGLLTNYHAPRSTVLMLAAAFAGWDNLLNAYNYAIENEYNFLSYGDSMLIL